MSRYLIKMLFPMALVLTACSATAADRACFDAAAKVPMLAQLPVIGMRFDQLARAQVEAGGTPEQIYVLGRQVTLVERIWRRLQEHSEFGCRSVQDGLVRDVEILHRVHQALSHGNSELEIERLSDTKAQQELTALADSVATLRTQIQALKAGSE